MPVLLNISTSQTLPSSEAPVSGFRASSFLTTIHGNQYYIISGVLGTQFSSGYGASILDGRRVVQSRRAHIQLALPACKTTGSLSLPSASSLSRGRGDRSDDSGDSVPAEEHIIDPSASFTHYYRIWGQLDLRNGDLTWFNLYFDNSELLLTTCMIDSIGPPFVPRSSHLRFRRETALTLVPVDEFKPDEGLVWTSPATGLTYPLRWRLGTEGRGLLEIQSVVANQDNADGGREGEIYMGFVTFKGVLDGRNVTGFGETEVRFVNPVDG
ncbi:hypothetical protein BDW75DRAFT_237392 [Aspergillus navahoensis]